MLEIDFDKVNVGVADVQFYEDDDRPVRIPPYMAVRALNPATCVDCPSETKQRTGLIAWLALRNDERTPTHWITLCEEHLDKTSRRKPVVLD